MKIKIIAVGTKMPDWVEAGCKEYLKRMPADFKVEFKEIPVGHRGKSSSKQTAIAKESEQILAAIDPREKVIALEVKGKPWSTEQLAQKCQTFRDEGENICLLVGGPDGLSDQCRARADLQWSLSPLTLPHPLVRVLLAEQLYRAWTILVNHPYHK